MRNRVKWGGFFSRSRKKDYTKEKGMRDMSELIVLNVD